MELYTTVIRKPNGGKVSVTTYSRSAKDAAVRQCGPGDTLIRSVPTYNATPEPDAYPIAF